MIENKRVVKVKGTPVEFGSLRVILPPLNLRALEQFGPALRSFTGDIQDMKQVAFVTDAVHTALLRNYPNATREEVAENLGLESLEEVMDALVKVTGLVHRLPDEMVAEEELLTGEVTAVS